MFIVIVATNIIVTLFSFPKTNSCIIIIIKKLRIYFQWVLIILLAQNNY